MAEARRQHWATAGPVLIEGATGQNAGIVNGAFEVVERPENEPPVYRRADGWDVWLSVNNGGQWAVSYKELARVHPIQEPIPMLHPSSSPLYLGSITPTTPATTGPLCTPTRMLISLFSPRMPSMASRNSHPASTTS